MRIACYDEELHIEAYYFEGIVQPFPNHFHDYYVIGCIEAGTRCLSCKDKEYVIEPGDILLFNPGDNHSCTQCDGKTLNYKALNISKEVMLSLAEEITGEKNLLGFSEHVIRDGELQFYLRALHQMIMESRPHSGAADCMKGSREFEKEEILLFLISELIAGYGQPFEKCIAESREEIELACAYMEQHFEEPVTLEDLCTCSHLSKSTLLRAFTKSKGVTPYRYLQAIRIDRAKKLLEQGVCASDAAMRTGFADQSHFTNFFHTFIGLSPAAYGRIFRGDGDEK